MPNSLFGNSTVRLRVPAKAEPGSIFIKLFLCCFGLLPWQSAAIASSVLNLKRSRRQFNTHIARLSLIVSSAVAGAKLPFGNWRMSPAFTTLSRVA